MNKLMLEKEKYKVIKGRFCCAGLVIPRFVSGVRCQGISNHIAHALLLLSLFVSQFFYLMDASCLTLCILVFYFT